MAGKNEVSVWIRAKDLGSKVVKGFERNLNALWKTGKNVAKGLAGVAAGATALTYALGRLSQQGARVADIQAAFERATLGQANAIGVLREASSGLVSDFELMQRHNQALALQVTKNADETGRLIQVAQGLSRVMGIDVAYGIESVITGVGRLSPRWIDNVGITVDATKANEEYAAANGLVVAKMTEAQQKAALLNAVLREGERILSDSGATTSTVGNGWVRLTTAFTNAKDELAKLIAKSPEVEEFFAALQDGIDQVVERLPEAVRKMAAFATTAVDVLSGGPAAATRRATLAGFRASSNPEGFRDLTREQADAAMAERRDLQARIAARTAAGPRPKMSTVMGGMAGVAAAERAAEDAGEKTVEELKAELASLDAQIEGTNAAIDQMNVELRESEAAAAAAAEAARKKREEEAAASRGAAAVLTPDPRVALARSGLVGAGQMTGKELSAALAEGQTGFRQATGGFRSGMGAGGGSIEVSESTAAAQKAAQKAAEEFLKGLEDAEEGFGDVARAATQVGLAAAQGAEGLKGLLPSLTNLLQSMPGVGKVGGALIGLGAGIFSSILSRSERPRVIVDEYSTRAQDQMRATHPPARESTSINNADATDEQLRQLDYLLRRMDQRRGGRRGAA